MHEIHLTTAAVDATVIRAVLKEECRRDKTPLECFNWLLDQTIFLHSAWKRIKCGRYSVANCFKAWRARESGFPGLTLGEDWLVHVYSGGPELLWRDLGRLLAELSTLLQGAGFAPPGEPVSMAVRIWGLFGRRP